MKQTLDATLCSAACLQNCTAAQLMSKKGNPHTATGALLEQSSFSDQLSVVRASNNSRTAPEYNAGLIGGRPKAAAALYANDVVPVADG
jgi:hypothetical protein